MRVHTLFLPIFTAAKDEKYFRLHIILCMRGLSSNRQQHSFQINYAYNPNPTDVSKLILPYNSFVFYMIEYALVSNVHNCLIAADTEYFLYFGYKKSLWINTIQFQFRLYLNFITFSHKKRNPNFHEFM